jgi:hypothetical protein
MRGRLDEVHAMLSVAEQQLEHDRRANPVLEVARRQTIDASLDRTASTPAGHPASERSAGDQREAAVRLLRQQWLGAGRKLDDLGDVGASRAFPVLDALGRERGIVRLGRRTIPLTRRHTEILVLLASHPHGMTTEEIARALYGDSGRPASVRTAICRLRKAFAPWIYSDRNQVKLELEADFLVVQRLLRTGLTREAARRYSAALLPRSEAPGIVSARDELDVWVRSAVMTSGDQEALWAWLTSASGCDDVPAWKRFVADLDFSDPRRALAVTRLARSRNALTDVA